MFERIAAEPSPAGAVALAEEMGLVRRELHENRRRMFELRLQGESIEEIATKLEVTERQVRRALQQVKERLEQRLVESTSDSQQAQRVMLRRQSSGIEQRSNERRPDGPPGPQPRKRGPVRG